MTTCPSTTPLPRARLQTVRSSNASSLSSLLLERWVYITEGKERELTAMATSRPANKSQFGMGVYRENTKSPCI